MQLKQLVYVIFFDIFGLFKNINFCVTELCTDV